MASSSWVSGADGSEFPIQNLPYGVFRPSQGQVARCGVAIGEMVLDLGVLADAGVFEGFDASCFKQPALNAFMGLGKPAWDSARATLTRLLSADEAQLRDDADLRAAALVPM